MAVLLPALLPIPPKLSKSSKADQHQKQINADTLLDVLELIFAPLQDPAHDGVAIDCAHLKVRRCLPILAACIADHMENSALHGTKSNFCPRCEVPGVELGTNMKVYLVRDYKIYHHYDYENWIGENDHADITPESLGIRLGQNVFYGLNWVSPSDLHKPDMLHTVYLGLFKPMMDWSHGFLKKHGQLEAFDEVWRALPAYPGFLVPKKAYREVTQWQGKEMWNLGRCALGVLDVALRQPGSAQLIPFKRALGCVRVLVNFNLMPQYRSHTTETITYMEDYLDTFHKMKNIFLEFQVTKRIRAKIDKQRRELRHERPKTRERITPSKQGRMCDAEREEETERCMDLIYCESHFIFIKMHLLSHFCDHIRPFANIPMYLTEFGELGHKTQIKAGWGQSNKNDASRLIVPSYSRQHGIRMRLLNLESLPHCGADLSPDVVEQLDTTRTTTAPDIRRRMLKGGRDNVSNMADFGQVLVSIQIICRGLIRFSPHNLPPERRLLENLEILESLPVELLTQLEIPVLAFQETERYDIHHAQCTVAHNFRNNGSRNDWVCVRAGTEDTYVALRGRLPDKLIALFKIRDYRCEDRLRRLAGVQFVSPVNSGLISDVHSLVTVQMKEDAREFTVVDIGTILGLVHLIPEGDRRWTVNSHIDLRTFNKVY